MKYKCIELEPPPLGEFVVLTDKNQTHYSISFFYEDTDCMRDSEDELLCYRSYSNVHDWKEDIYWSPLPRLKSLVRKNLPIGKEVIFKTVSRDKGDGPRFVIRALCREDLKEARDLYEGWFYFEDMLMFRED